MRFGKHHVSELHIISDVKRCSSNTRPGDLVILVFPHDDSYLGFGLVLGFSNGYLGMCHVMWALDHESINQ